MADLLTDAQHQQILTAIKAHFEDASKFPAADLPNVWGFGPVTDANTSAKKADFVILHDPTKIITLPSNGKIDVMIDGDTWKITLVERGRKRFKVRFHGPDYKVSRRTLLKTSASVGIVGAIAPHSTALAADAAPTNAASATPTQAIANSVPDPNNTTLICPPPKSPNEHLMGGDAIYNWQNLDISKPRNTYWGTIAFVGDADGKIKFSDNGTEISTEGKALSCAHVLYHKDATTNIRTYHHASGVTYDQALSGWSADWPPTPPSDKWPDMAVATIDTSINHSRNTVRALGVLQGVKAPKAGDILTKYGATTGLTVARDIGMVWRRLPDESGEFMQIRAVSNQFSRPGDSGSAVIHLGGGIGADDYRKLAGFILAGSIDDNEQYYLPVLEFGDDPEPTTLNAIYVKL